MTMTPSRPLSAAHCRGQRLSATKPIGAAVNRHRARLDTAALGDTDHELTPCQRDPARWDTDQTTLDGIRAAARDCETLCPLFDACRKRVADLRSASGNRSGSIAALAGMVWAGEPYNHVGTRLRLDAPHVRSGPRQERDGRYVTKDGLVFDGHAGAWVAATA